MDSDLMACRLQEGAQLDEDDATDFSFEACIPKSTRKKQGAAHPQKKPSDLDGGARRGAAPSGCGPKEERTVLVSASPLCPGSP